MRKEQTSVGTIGAITGVLLLIVFPTLYALSIGPAVWMVNMECLTEGAFFSAYYPVVSLAEHSAAAERILIWYTDLWSA